jgi:hypothetical protein
MFVAPKGPAMHTLRHYRVRLSRSQRLRYRLARLLLGTILWLLLTLLLVLGTVDIINRH